MSEPERLRLFVAVDPEPRVRRRLGRIQEALKGVAGRAGAQVSYPAVENLHLTLEFLGSVPASEVPDLCASLARIGATDRFEICFEGLGAFPSWSRPKILWVGVTRGVEPLKSLAEQVDRCCGEVGFDPEAREFSPHLTLGRVKRMKRSARFVVDNVSPREAGSSLVSEVTLYRSELGSNGPTYTPLVRIPLRGSGAPAGHQSTRED